MFQRFALAVGLAFLTSSLVASAEGFGRPIVTHAEIDESAGVLYVYGHHLAHRRAPDVTLGGVELSVLKFQEDAISAKVPASLLTGSGSYRLVVGSWGGDQDFVVTVGSTGPQGAKGEAGPAGPAGVAGPAGPAGPAGAAGLEGPMGPQGMQGAAGPVGPQGAQGQAGPAGAAGLTGPTGLTGPMGPMGPMGLEGAAGAIGQTGPAGPAGPIGPIGPMGPQGPQGSQGPPGSIERGTRVVQCPGGMLTVQACLTPICTVSGGVAYFALCDGSCRVNPAFTTPQTCAGANAGYLLPNSL